MKNKSEHAELMRRAIELGATRTYIASPNPGVGAVLAVGTEIIGEGATTYDGGPHAEVMAVRDAERRGHGNRLAMATMYVSLEPCSISGRTPPCADLIIERGIPRVYIGSLDFTPGVCGNGAERLRRAGVKVCVGLLQDNAFEVARVRHTITLENRPYVILKQAVSANRYVGNRTSQVRLSGLTANTVSHRWRSEVGAILVGAGTVVADDPSLTTRLVSGSSPLRVILQLGDRPLPLYRRLFTDGAPTVLATAFEYGEGSYGPQTELLDVGRGSKRRQLRTLFGFLLRRRVGSLLVEGGPTTLSLFDEQDCWDEYREWRCPTVEVPPDGDAVPAHRFTHTRLRSSQRFGDDVLDVYEPRPGSRRRC